MSYWEERQKQLKKSLANDEVQLKKKLSQLYDAEARRLEKEIAAYYSKYGRDNVIEYRKLMKTLPESDKTLLLERMDEFARKYPQYKHLMPIRASIYKLDRLQGLQYSIIMQQLEIGAKENDLVQKHLTRTASRSLKKAGETMGFGSSFYAVNKDIVKNFVGGNWSNRTNFSSRIWKNKDKLAHYLNTDLAQGFARGDSYDRMIKNLINRFGKVSRNDAYRLIYTEGTYVQAESSMQPFIEDFDKYQISTVGDSKVCPICSAMSQQVFEIKDRVPGENFPPFHPWCRCTFIVVVDDWDEWKRSYMARHGGDVNDRATKISERLGAVNGFHTKSDPMRDKLGSARKSNPKELIALKKKIRALGVEINESGTEMKYGPNPIAGKPGRLTMDPEASYSAWLHEYKHIKDDEASGWAGMKVLMSPKKAVKWEDAAYDVEIDHALSLGYNKIANALRYLKGERRKEIHGKKDFK